MFTSTTHRLAQGFITFTVIISTAIVIAASNQESQHWIVKYASAVRAPKLYV